MERTLGLIQRAHDGDKEARDILVEENVGLVWSIVRRFQHRGVEPEDLFQIGTIGLIKAVSTFDGNRNSRLGTYAARCIENTIHTQRHFWRLILQKCLFVCREKTGFFPENTIY